MNAARRRAITVAFTLIGMALLIFTLRRVDIPSIHQFAIIVGPRLPLMFLPAAAWQLVRTAAWQHSFPRAARPRFDDALRVRIAAEAFSYLTISGVAGEPLKVALLSPSVPPSVSTAAIIGERVAYLAVTAAMIARSAADP